MGEGDAWPGIREKLMTSEILVLASPIWVGHPSSLAQRVLERLDAELSETDERGRPSMFDKVGLVAVVGNEDGAHHLVADLSQGLGEVGFTIPAQGGPRTGSARPCTPLTIRTLKSPGGDGERHFDFGAQRDSTCPSAEADAVPGPAQRRLSAGLRPVRCPQGSHDSVTARPKHES